MTTLKNIVDTERDGASWYKLADKLEKPRQALMTNLAGDTRISTAIAILGAIGYHLEAVPDNPAKDSYIITSE